MITTINLVIHVAPSYHTIENSPNIMVGAQIKVVYHATGNPMFFFQNNDELCCGTNIISVLDAMMDTDTWLTPGSKQNQCHPRNRERSTPVNPFGLAALLHCSSGSQFSWIKLTIPCSSVFTTSSLCNIRKIPVCVSLIKLYSQLM